MRPDTREKTREKHGESVEYRKCTYSRRFYSMRRKFHDAAFFMWRPTSDRVQTRTLANAPSRTFSSAAILWPRVIPVMVGWSERRKETLWLILYLYWEGNSVRIALTGSTLKNLTGSKLTWSQS